MNKNFFWQDTTGLKADIERHRKKEDEIREQIESARKILEKEPGNKTAQSAIRVYSNLLDILLASKAETVSKIGKSARRS